MKVAVTSQNFRTVTGHAGKARRFLVFYVQQGQTPVEIDRIDLPKELSFHAYHGEAPHPVQAAGIDRMVTGGCGDGFRARMARMGIQLSVTEDTDPVSAAAAAAAAPLASFDIEGGQGAHLGGVQGGHHHQITIHQVKRGQNRHAPHHHHDHDHGEGGCGGQGGCGCGH